MTHWISTHFFNWKRSISLNLPFKVFSYVTDIVILYAKLSLYPITSSFSSKLYFSHLLHIKDFVIRTKHVYNSVQFSSVAQPCPTLCNPMDCSTPGLPVHHQLLEFTQTHVHWVGDAIQSSHPLPLPSPPTFNLSQHQGLFQWVSCSHQVAKVWEFQLQYQSFQWIFRTDFL